MKQFSYIVTALLMMLPAIPLAGFFAVSPTSPTYTHFIYMFAHANIFHWAINAWGITILHRLYTPARCIAAYTTAVAISFLPSTLNSQLSTLNSQLSTLNPQLSTPTLGLSVITCFLLGGLIRYCWKRNKTAFWQAVTFLAAGFFLPNFAATYHLLAFLAGTIYFAVERNVRSFLQFSKT